MGQTAYSIAMQQMGDLINKANLNKAALDAALSETVTGIINVETGFNAVPDGVTDSSTFIQAAIDYAIANGLQDIYFPPGRYVASGLINVDKVNFVGEGASFVNGTYAIFPYGMQAKKARLGKGLS